MASARLRLSSDTLILSPHLANLVLQYKLYVLGDCRLSVRALRAVSAALGLSASVQGRISVISEGKSDHPFALLKGQALINVARAALDDVFRVTACPEAPHPAASGREFR